MVRTVALDGGIHHIGTKPNHIIIPIGTEAIGGLINSKILLGIGIGMILLMLWNAMRVKQPYYRWREESANETEPNH